MNDLYKKIKMYFLGYSDRNLDRFMLIKNYKLKKTNYGYELRNGNMHVGLSEKTLQMKHILLKQ